MVKNVNDEALKQLIESGLRKTDLRLEMLKFILRHPAPFTQGELLLHLEKVMHSVDRVTVYRNLHQFCELQLLHEVAANTYVGCTHQCAQHPHVLLFCERCRKHTEIRDHSRLKNLLKALEEVRFFGSSLPLSLKGICKECS
jgi:Fe2+ or Zn2+ uptake regulation protein